MIVEQSKFIYGEHVLGVTCSFGGKIYDYNEEFDINMQFADEALYSCKEKGRNCVSVSDSQSQVSQGVVKNMPISNPFKKC